MTRMPFWSDSATFSAACRQTLQVRNRPSPSSHWLVCELKRRGVDAIRKFATAAPDGVNRSSGSATMFPTTVIGVSPCAMRFSSVKNDCVRSLRLLVIEADRPCPD